MTQKLCELKKPLAVVLEGGYTPELIAEAAHYVVQALRGLPAEEGSGGGQTPGKKADDAVSTTTPTPTRRQSPENDCQLILEAVRRRLNTLPCWQKVSKDGPSGRGIFQEEESKKDAAAELAEELEAFLR